MRVILICLYGCLPVAEARAQDDALTRAKLLLMTDAIIATTTYEFVDKKGERYSSPEQAQPGTQLGL